MALAGIANGYVIGPTRGIGNGQDNGLGRIPVFLENRRSLENKKLGFGQSSLPIWVLGTIEFIWAGRIPLPTHHKMISSQKHFFGTPKFSQKGPRAKMSTPTFTFFEDFPKRAKRVARLTLAKRSPEPRPQNSKRSHGAKNIFSGRGTFLLKGYKENPVLYKEN